jgi:hypothetical protein
MILLFSRYGETVSLPVPLGGKTVYVNYCANKIFVPICAKVVSICGFIKLFFFNQIETYRYKYIGSG